MNKELHQLPNYRQIHAKFIGPTNYRGARVQIFEPKRFNDEKTHRKTIADTQRPNEHMNEFIYRVLCANGFNVKARSTCADSYIFLCDNWGDEFVQIADIDPSKAK